MHSSCFIAEREATPGLRSHTESGVATTASCRCLFGRLLARALALAVALLEAGHAAAAVEDLLLAGVEGVALRADLDVNLSARLRAARRERVAAAAVHRRLDVVRVNARFHGFLFDRGPRVAPPLTGRYRREPEPRVSAPLCQVNRQRPKRVRQALLFRSAAPTAGLPRRAARRGDGLRPPAPGPGMPGTDRVERSSVTGSRAWVRPGSSRYWGQRGCAAAGGKNFAVASKP